MSVVGFDVGNDCSCVAIARKRGIDVLMNKESTRETPAMVCFGDKMRFLGTDAAAKVGMNPRATPHQLKRLLGKRWADPALQADVARLPFKVGEAPDGGVLVHVTFGGEPASFTPEQLVAMVLTDLKKIAEAEAGIAVTDCALSVPTFYTQAERAAMLDAAGVAGLNCLRLVNETTATALAYGIFKTDLPETDPVHVGFVDVGHAHTQVSIVSFRKGGLSVRCHAWDRDLGGRDIDELLFDHFCKEFAAKFKIDVRSNAKASFKLRTQCERLKKVLSANAESPINIECLMDDVDVRSLLNREQLEEMVEPFLARLNAVLRAAVEASGLQPGDISSVEVLGGSTRVPAVFKLVGDVFGLTPSRTLNAKEVVSRGAALQCAMISPLIKVREFDVQDAAPYGVTLAYENKDGQPKTDVLFARHSFFPSKKLITLFKSEPFSVELAYEPDDRIPPAFPRSLGTFTVHLPKSDEKKKVKLTLSMNLHGMASLDSAVLHEEEEADEALPVTVAPPPAANGAPPAEGDAPMDAEAPPAADGAAPMDADAAAGPPPPPAPAAEKKVKVKKTALRVDAAGVAGWDGPRRNDMFEAECQMAAADKLQEDTNEAKNALESYIYDLRDRLYARLAPFVAEAEREALSAQLSAMEDWLYGDGEDETKSAYVAKLAELRAKGDPIDARAADDEARPGAVEELQRIAGQYLSLADSTLPAHAHLEAGERDTLRKEAGAALEWLNEKVALQAQLHKYDAPLLSVADIHKKRDVVERVCKPIAARPPPKKEAPPPPPAPAPAAEPAAGGEPAAAGGEAAPDAAPMEAEGGEGAAPMEQ
ncbi:HSP70-14 [Scenedesmus sp. PABB004]|nr:HSP70-14 [Scenedesmus sp. PABB004]